jgi:hypothetical protein
MYMDVKTPVEPSRGKNEKQMYIQYEEDYIDFGNYCRNVLGMQCQTGYYLLEGLAGHPKLKDGLRITGNTWNYHEIKIHKDDAEIFRQRYKAWLNRGTDHDGWNKGDEL